MKPLLILFAHGSRDPDWNATFEALTERVAGRLGAAAVRLAYLEFASPTLEEAVREAAAEGRDMVRILPLFLASGKHVREDLPTLVRRLREATPDLRIELLPPVGEDPGLLDLLVRIAVEAAEAGPSPGGTGGASPRGDAVSPGRPGPGP